jgi:hypothetical protein
MVWNSPRAGLDETTAIRSSGSRRPDRNGRRSFLMQSPTLGGNEKTVKSWYYLFQTCM